MERRTIRKNVGHEEYFPANSYSGDTSNIDDVINYFINAKAMGATHIQWRATLDYDERIEDCIATAFYEEKESFEDFEKRMVLYNTLKREKEIEAEKKERELFEQLKTKFGK